MMEKKKQSHKQKRTSGIGDGQVGSVSQDDGETLSETTSSSDVETVGRRDGAEEKFITVVQLQSLLLLHTHTHKFSSRPVQLQQTERK